VVIGLEIGTDEHFVVDAGQKVVLGRLDVPMNVDVGQIRAVDGARRIFVMQGARVGVPAPSAFFGDQVAFERGCTYILGAYQQSGKQK